MPLVKPTRIIKQERPIDQTELILTNARNRTVSILDRIQRGLSRFQNVRVPNSTKALLHDVWFGAPQKKSLKPLVPYHWTWSTYPRKRWVGFDRTRKRGDS